MDKLTKREENMQEILTLGLNMVYMNSGNTDICKEIFIGRKRLDQIERTRLATYYDEARGGLGDLPPIYVHNNRVGVYLDDRYNNRIQFKGLLHEFNIQLKDTNDWEIESSSEGIKRGSDWEIC